MASIKDAFRNRRSMTVFMLGFFSGLPLGLTDNNVQAWLTDEKFDIKTVGWFSLVAVPYTWKFLWSPLVDRFPIPLMGRRRGWIFAAQLALVAGLTGMALTEPRQSLALFAFFCVAVAFFSATQDIGIDAYTTEVLRPEERGIGAGLSTLGYRIAMFVSAAGMPLAQHTSWRVSYLVMAALMFGGMVVDFFGPEPEHAAKPPRTMREAVIEPFHEFIKRKHAYLILLFVILYKLDFVVATKFSTRFMMEVGFSKDDVFVVNKGFGFAALMIGAIGGGALIARWGLTRCLWVFGIMQAIAAVGFMVLTVIGKNYLAMTAAIVAEQFAGGLGNAAFVAFIMSVCDLRYTATQYALLSSLMAIARTTVGVPAGYLVASVGWFHYFSISILLGLPALLLLSRFAPWPGFAGEPQKSSGRKKPS